MYVDANMCISVTFAHQPQVGLIQQKHCQVCEGCQRDDCGDCSNCRDMIKFGGPGKKKKAYIQRRCKGIGENKQIHMVICIHIPSSG